MRFGAAGEVATQPASDPQLQAEGHSDHEVVLGHMSVVGQVVLWNLAWSLRDAWNQQFWGRGCSHKLHAALHTFDSKHLRTLQAPSHQIGSDLPGWYSQTCYLRCYSEDRSSPGILFEMVSAPCTSTSTRRANFESMLRPVHLLVCSGRSNSHPGS